MDLREQSGLSSKMWETLLLWSGYKGYHSIDDIAKLLTINKNTVLSRIRLFAKQNPKAYEKILQDRQTIKKTSTRLKLFLGKPVSFESSMEEYVKEKF